MVSGKRGDDSGNEGEPGGQYLLLEHAAHSSFFPGFVCVAREGCGADQAGYLMDSPRYSIIDSTYCAEKSYRYHEDKNINQMC